MVDGQLPADNATKNVAVDTRMGAGNWEREMKKWRENR